MTCFVNLLLVSGPVREKLWIAAVAFFVAWGLAVAIGICLSTPGAYHAVQR
jgi:hypothetical protein